MVEPKRLGRATIYDVARDAGVSPSTVSRAFSRPGQVSSETAAHVREVAERLGYRRERIFRSDEGSRTGTIGLAVSDVTNPFYFPIIRGAEEAATAAGYALLLADAQESGEVERAMLNRALPLLDGLVIGSSRLSDTELRALARTVPVVVLNRVVHGLPCVVPDNARGVRRAVEHLASLDHSRLLYVAGPEASWADGTRWRAVREAAMDLSVTESRIGPFVPTADGGRPAARVAAQREATGIIVYNAVMAMGLVRELRALDVRVPEDLSVVCFDNIFAADLVTPALTTVGAPLTELGTTATRYVLSLAAGTASDRTTPVTMPMRLVPRESSGPAPGRGHRSR